MKGRDIVEFIKWYFPTVYTNRKSGYVQISIHNSSVLFTSFVAYALSSSFLLCKYCSISKFRIFD